METRNKSAAQRLLEVQLGRDLEAELRELYVDRRLTDREIAVRFGVARSTVRDWRADLGIERSERSAAVSS